MVTVILKDKNEWVFESRWLWEEKNLVLPLKEYLTSILPPTEACFTSMWHITMETKLYIDLRWWTEWFHFPLLLRLASFLILSTSSQNCTITVPNIVSIVFSSSVVLTTCPIWVISRMKNCLRCSIWTLSFPATILSLTSRSTMLECELHNVAIHDMRTCHFVSPCHDTL